MKTGPHTRFNERIVWLLQNDPIVLPARALPPGTQQHRPVDWAYRREMLEDVRDDLDRCAGLMPPPLLPSADGIGLMAQSVATRVRWQSEHVPGRRWIPRSKVSRTASSDPTPRSRWDRDHGAVRRYARAMAGRARSWSQIDPSLERRDRHIPRPARRPDAASQPLHVRSLRSGIAGTSLRRSRCTTSCRTERDATVCRNTAMRDFLLLFTMAIGAGASACTFHAAIGGQGLLRGDAMHGGEEVATGGPILLLGGGPCLRWPRLRTSLAVEGALRGASAEILAANETFWIFDEGYARRHESDVTRTSLALKTRFAGGWNTVARHRVLEAGVGLAIVRDSDHTRGDFFSTSRRKRVRAGDFHAVSLDLIATYAPDRNSADDTWIGAQLAIHVSGIATDGISGSRIHSKQRYGVPQPGQVTDCNSGHLP